MTARERAIAAAMRNVWRQQGEALRDVTIAGTSFDWVRSEAEARRIVEMTRGDIGIEVAVNYDEAARALKVSLDPFVENIRGETFVENHVFQFARRVNETTHDEFQDALARAVADGQSPDEFRREVREIFTGFEQAGRDEMIARTEIARAQGGGTQLAWQDSEVVEAKIWDSANDACPFCLGMDGRVVDLTGNFFKGGETFTVKDDDGTELSLTMNYGDIPYPPIHPFCRCAIRPKLFKA